MVQEFSGVYPEGLGVVGSGRDTLPEIREWSGGPPVGPGVVERLFRRLGIGWETLPYVREWSGGPPVGPGVVGRTSRRSRSSREFLP